MCNRLDSIPACGGRTARQTDTTDILPRHGPRYAYASRGNKTAEQRIIIQQYGE